MKKFDLRADLESRIYQPKKKSELTKWIVFGAVAVCSLSTLLYVNRDLGQFQLPKPTNNPFDSSKEAPNPKLARSSTTHMKNSEDIVIRPGAREKLLSEGSNIKQPELESSVPGKKQTVFNDNNYQPRGSVNSIAPPPSRYYDQGQARTNAQVREINRSFNGTRTTRSARWSWKSEKSYRSGTFTYIETDRGIETHSVCGNYKSGSFDYRDCRKAAKKWFQDRCSSEFRFACAAGEMTP